MNTLEFGMQSAVNLLALDEQLRARLGERAAGVSLADGNLYVHVADGEDAEALRGEIEAVIAAHDPAVQTRQQQAEAAREMAVEALKTADVAAIRAGAEAKGVTVAQVAAQVAALASVVEKLREALGLTSGGERD